MVENRICQNCKNSFVIEPEDFDFYKKISVPPPTWCPECRMMRKLAWLKTFQLYKRPCDLCGEDNISMYPKDASYAVYCHRCWWSDKWNPMDYGRDYDFSKPFFEQFNELMHKIPLRGLAIDETSSKLSPYSNHLGYGKNCYLLFYSETCEDSAYDYYVTKVKSVFDSSIGIEAERCYDCTNFFRSHGLVGSCGNVTGSINCYFLRDCDNCQNCFGSANLRNKSYVFMNEQVTKEDYQKKMSEIDLGSYANYRKYKELSQQAWKKFPPRPVYDDFSKDCTGSYVFQSKNCQECYDSTNCEDSKYLMLMKKKTVKDSYDFIDWGLNAERVYECITVGENVADVKFSQDCGHDQAYVEYCKSCMGGSNLFGCIDLQQKKYCILNKQYSPEEYKNLRDEIIEQMDSLPYKNEKGAIFKYGEFFPMELSPHDYNDTFAQLFFPMTKNAVLKDGLHWIDHNLERHAITKKSSELPDHIRDAGLEILREVVECSNCGRGYRIIEMELAFLKNMNLPLPRQCPFCRIEAKIRRWIWQMTLVTRTCGKCGKKFRTHYKREDVDLIYCKECYFKEIL